MNIEELKSAWQVYDSKIQKVQAINEKLIEVMIKERSLSRVSKIKRQYNGFFMLIFAELFVLTAVLTGNPFDFKYKAQFIPYVLLLICIMVAFFNLLKLYRRISGPVSNYPIGEFLRTILESYEKNKVFEKWFGIIFLSIGFIIPLSFLPQKLARKELTPALLETFMMMAVTLLMYFLAFKLGAFKNHNKEKFSNDLDELNELKAMSLEIGEGENNQG